MDPKMILNLVTNRPPYNFDYKTLDNLKSCLINNSKPNTPAFGDGGLVQALAGLLKKGDYSQNKITTWYGISMGDADYDVMKGHMNNIIKTINKKYDHNIYPHIKQEGDKRDKNRIINFKFSNYDFDMRYIFLEQVQMDSYYKDTSNQFLWPLFHLNKEKFYKDKNNAFPKPTYSSTDFKHYDSVNGTIAEVITNETKKRMPIVEKDNPLVVWIQDYHLMLTSMYYQKHLKKQNIDNSNIHVGQFMHTPFFNINTIRELLINDRRENPKKEKFSMNMEEILQYMVYGMLGNNFIGFHTNEYARNFAEVVDEWFPEIKVKDKGNHFVLNHKFRDTLLGAYPIGLDIDRVCTGLITTPSLDYKMSNKDDLKERIGKDKEDNVLVFGGLERLDYTKGIPERFKIFEEIIKQKKTRLYQITADSRQDAEPYQNLKKIVNEELERINSIYKYDEKNPIEYIDSGIKPPMSYKFQEEIPIMLITTKEDGLNLVAKEFVLSKFRLPYEERGIMVLGECGAKTEYESQGFGLDDGIVYINPKKIKESAQKILHAINENKNISNRLIDYCKNRCRVEDWAEANLNSIIKKEYIG
jgi:trehalose 6-phosphate synthase/phosphatase